MLVEQPFDGKERVVGKRMVKLDSSQKETFTLVTLLPLPPDKPPPSAAASGDARKCTQNAPKMHPPASCSQDGTA